MNDRPSSMPAVSVAVIGCTLARPRYGTALSLCKSLRVSALVDTESRYIRAWAKELGGQIELHADADALIAAPDRPHAVIVEAPLAERAALLLKCIPAFRAILATPPFAATLEETDRLIHAATAHGAVLVPIFPRRCDPILEHAIQMAQSGEIGLFQQVRCDWSFPITRAFGIEIGGDPDAGSWQSLLQYIGCHSADVCRWCFGDVLTVSADVDSEEVLDRVPPRQRETAPLLAIFVLGQEQGPSTCHLTRARSVVPSERYSLTGQMGAIEVVISSSNHESALPPSVTIHRTGQRPQLITDIDLAHNGLPAPVYRMVEMLDRFALAAHSEADFSPRDTDARAALEIVHAAYYSAQDHRKITLPLRRSPAAALP